MGVVFSYNGSFRKAQKKQILQARRAMYAVLNKARILRLPFDIIIELFDRCVVPILLYGCEIWGYENINELDKFHRQFLRIVFKAFKCTPNVMLYGESGAYNIETYVNSRLVHFWTRLRNCNNGKISTILCK